MIRWLHLTLVSSSSLLLALVILVILKRCFWPKTRKNFDAAVDIERGQSLQTAITRLHQVSPHHHGSTAKSKHRDVFLPTFRWIDHPFLITEAVENGWSRFAFTDVVLPSSPCLNTPRSILGACIRDPGNESRVEIGWEVCEGSVDFMQKVELNPDLKKIATTVSAVRTALPLPGPNLGNSCFPQEAYFEITILSCTGDCCADHLSAKYGWNSGDKIQLIGEDFNKKDSHRPTTKLGKHGRKNGGVLICVGLTGGGPDLSAVPGSYPGSVGFNSNGCVYLDGTKLVHESEKDDEWGISGCVVGCGYNPGQKKVFFTVDSQLVREIHCKSEEFSSPLYPMLAANAGVTVLVNLGQSLFKFGPANLQRTPNPCFIRPLSTSPSLGHEDSKEFFSMGRIDSQWLQRTAIRSNNNTVSSIKDIQYDQESDGDLFEIVLDSIGRSPHTTAYHQ